MVIWTFLSWIMSAIALFGTILNAERNIYGFWFWLVSNMYMTIRFTYIGEYPQALLFLIYTALAVRGIISWKNKEHKSTGYRRMSKEEVKKIFKEIKKEVEKEKNKKV